MRLLCDHACLTSNHSGLIDEGRCLLQMFHHAVQMVTESQ